MNLNHKSQNCSYYLNKTSNIYFTFEPSPENEIYNVKNKF